MKNIFKPYLAHSGKKIVMLLLTISLSLIPKHLNGMCCSKEQEEKSQSVIDQELIDSVEKGKSKTVKKLLHSKADINYDNEVGDTPLILAVKRNHSKILKLLLTSSIIEINKSDRFGNTALLWAAYYGHTKIVKMLLSSGADVNHTDFNNETALILAIGENHIKTIEALLEAPSININIINEDGYTPLIQAIRKNNTQLLDLLLKTKSLDINKPDKNRKTALMYVCKKNNLEEVNKLLLTGADWTIQNKKGKTPYDYGNAKVRDLIDTTIREKKALLVSPEYLSQVQQEVSVYFPESLATLIADYARIVKK